MSLRLCKDLAKTLASVNLAVSATLAFGLLAIFGLVIADGWFISIPYSLATMLVWNIPVVRYFITFLGALATLLAVKHALNTVKPKIPKVYMYALALAAYFGGIVAGSGALTYFLYAVVAPYMIAFVTQMINMIYGFLMAIAAGLTIAGMLILFPETAPYAVYFAMMYFMFFAFSGIVLIILLTFLSTSAMYISNRLCTVAFNAFGERRGIGIGVMTIVRGGVLGVELSLTMLTIYATIVILHMCVAFALFISLIGSIGWRFMVMPAIYMTVNPGAGIAAAGVTAWSVAKLLFRFFGERIFRIFDQLRQQIPYISILILVYGLLLIPFYIFRAVTEWVLILFALMLASSVLALAGARRVKPRDIQPALASIATCMIAYSIGLFLGIARTLTV